ncbi:MAG: carboxypeptidase-like regulatory domain-containing protein, partial [Rubripirellula sp.]|nr:carboxypeptidase-like regulatory domain-containing protein [Rubripirellula sp.]
MNLNTAGGDAVDQSTLSNMRVLLAGFDQQGLYVFREAVVDANGRYRFEDVPQGNFQLSVKSKLENVEGETRAIAVAAGEELEIDLTVTLKPVGSKKSAKHYMLPIGDFQAFDRDTSQPNRRSCRRRQWSRNRSHQNGDKPRSLTGLAEQLYISLQANDGLGFVHASETPMKFILQPWQLMLIILASWANRQQQEVIEYLRTENAVLKEKFSKKRILLTDDQRRRLAVKGKLLGRKQLEQVGTLFTPDTILRWHRQLVANKWDYSDRKEKRPGRPRIRQVIIDLTIKFAKENPTWGYDRISGALS